jgi:hypothetical protein
VFTPEQRAWLRADLLERAASDKRISGAAITGSAAAGREDRWSDIDLAFGVSDGAELPNVLSEWTRYMYDRHLAVHHCDVHSGAWIYRVFLLPATLQVDLAFVPASEFRGLSPAFRLVSGTAQESWLVPPPTPESLIGLALLYALHVRSSIARQKLWQAEYMISAVRDHSLALACLRHGLPTAHGRGCDQVPEEVTARFENSLVRQLDAAELSRAFRIVLSGLLNEIERVDAELARRLEEPLRRLCDAHADASACS